MQEMKSTYANDDLSCKLLWGMDGLLSSKSLLSSDDDGDADDGDADFDALSSSKGSGEAGNPNNTRAGSRDASPAAAAITTANIYKFPDLKFADG